MNSTAYAMLPCLALLSPSLINSSLPPSLRSSLSFFLSLFLSLLSLSLYLSLFSLSLSLSFSLFSLFSLSLSLSLSLCVHIPTQKKKPTLTSRGANVPVVCLTSITLLALHTRLALAYASSLVTLTRHCTNTTPTVLTASTVAITPCVRLNGREHGAKVKKTSDESWSKGV